MNFFEFLKLALGMLITWWLLEILTRNVNVLPKVRKQYPKWLRYIWNVTIIILFLYLAVPLGWWTVGISAVILSFLFEKLFPIKK